MASKNRNRSRSNLAFGSVLFGFRLVNRNAKLNNKLLSLYQTEYLQDNGWRDDEDGFDWQDLGTDELGSLNDLLVSPDVRILLQDHGYPASAHLYGFDFSRNSLIDQDFADELDLVLGWRLAEFPAICYTPDFKQFLQANHTILGWLGV